MTIERKTIQIVDITDEQKTVKITARVVEPVELQGSLVEFQVDRATHREISPEGSRGATRSDGNT